MNKRTRNLAVAAGLAAAGVAFDRLTAAPDEAEAAPPPAATSSSSAPEAATAGASQASTPAPPASATPAGRLDARLLRQGTRPAGSEPANPFRPRVVAVRFDPTEPVEAAAPRVDVAAFLSRRPVAAVLGDGGRARAVVAGEVLRVGDVRDGMRLEEIRGRHVVWSGGGVRFIAGLRAAERAPEGRGGALPGVAAADPIAALFDR